MQKGLSLLELLISLGILCTALALGMPSMTQSLDRHRTMAEADMLLHALQLARHTAITHNSATRVHPLNSDWTNGWQVFIDRNDDGIPDAQTSVITHSPEISARLKATRTLQQRILFLGDGHAVLPGGGFQAGTFTLCEEHSTRSHNLIISRIGRVRRTTSADNARCTPR